MHIYLMNELRARDYLLSHVICYIKARHCCVMNWQPTAALQKKEKTQTQTGHRRCASLFYLLFANHAIIQRHCRSRRRRNVIIIMSLYSSVNDGRLNLNRQADSDLPSSRAPTKQKPFFFENISLYSFYGPLFYFQLFNFFFFSPLLAAAVSFLFHFLLINNSSSHT